jgi:hypothetical protein
MNDWKQQIRRFLALGALAWLVASCNSNFIPVPPPGDPTFEPVQVVDATGAPRQVWQVSGALSSEMKNARVFVFNNSLGVGVIGRANEDGGYSTGLLDGNLGDQVELHYETADGERSPTTCRLLVQGVGKTPCP